MIVVTRLNGGRFGVNPDLVQRIDSAPDTILTLIDGTKYIVEESMEQVIDRINEHRSHLLARAQEIAAAPYEVLHGGASLRDQPHRPVTPAAPSTALVAADGHLPTETPTEDHLAPAVPLRPRSR